jgi:HEAT repeat protein
VTDARAVDRAARFASLGHQERVPDDDVALAGVAVTDDPDPRVRAAALGALVRAGHAGQAMRAWAVAVTDADPAVRRRAADLGPAAAQWEPDAVGRALVAALGDTDVTVVEAVAWALGELGTVAVDAGAVEALAAVTTEHRDPIAREAAVAALGALGDPAGLPAVLAACDDRPAVRRRAVLALAPFEGDDVDAALARALTDKDWQVRQAAEDLTASS